MDMQTHTEFVLIPALVMYLCLNRHAAEINQTLRQHQLSRRALLPFPRRLLLTSSCAESESNGTQKPVNDAPQKQPSFWAPTTSLNCSENWGCSSTHDKGKNALTQQKENIQYRMTKKKSSPTETFLWHQILHEVYGIYPKIKQN